MATSSIGHLNEVENVIASDSISEQYQQQLSDADFATLYTNNNCFTWSNREKMQQ